MTTVAVLCLALSAPAAGPIKADLAGFRAERGVDVRQDGDRLTLTWPSGGGKDGRVVFDLGGRGPLIGAMGVGGRNVLERVDPVTFVTVGVRENNGRPRGMSPFNVFFDSPAKRPFETFRAVLDAKAVKVSGKGGRATLAFDGLTAGPFRGALEVTVYAGTGLVHVEAVVATDRDNVAFLYDAGLALAEGSEPPTFSWVDTEGAPSQGVKAGDDRAVAVRHRAIAAATAGGAVACFPPPHQFFFPRDLTDNQKTVWFGAGHRGLEPRPAFGVRQTETGGGNYVPWYNAPPGTSQRLGVFYLLAEGGGGDAIRESLKFTHGDRYPDLPGRVTFTSHWHLASAVAAMEEVKAGKARTTPDFATMFKAMNVKVVHLAEFHGDGHPGDPGPLRLPEMQAMFDECERLSDGDLLVLPGEEANVHLGHGPGRHPGHWLYLFPKPVYWTMNRAAGRPFAEPGTPYGTVYHVGNASEVARLLRQERGLAWTAHPRIKASNWWPDDLWDDDVFRDPLWLGGAWKAMPADLSEPRLGRRVLDLLDDQSNAGLKKYAPGEVDVFKVDHTHELYGHMNVNYLALDRAPRFRDDWSPVLDALRSGRFFVTTGEVLLTDLTLGGKPTGETIGPSPPGDRPELAVSLEWTFPLRFLEVVSGDGRRVRRERVDLSDTPPFGKATLRLRPDLAGKTWARVEAWDVAADGAFSQPVWIAPAPVPR